VDNIFGVYFVHNLIFLIVTGNVNEYKASVGLSTRLYAVDEILIHRRLYVKNLSIGVGV